MKYTTQVAKAALDNVVLKTINICAVFQVGHSFTHTFQIYYTINSHVEYCVS